MRHGISRRQLAALAAGLLLAAPLARASAQPAQPQEHRIATLAPRGSAWMKILERASAEITEQTGGRVKTKYYDSGTQGDERDVVRKMRLGQLDGAALTAVGLAMIDESIRVLELPRMFASVEELDYVRQKMWSHFQKKFEAKGFILSSEGDVGWVYFYSQAPVSSLAELRKLKVWLWGDDSMVKAIYDKLKISGVPLGVPDVLPAFTSGRVDAAYNSPLGAVALQWNSKVKYMTSMPMTYAIGATVLRKEIWDKMSPEDRAVLDKVARKQAKKLKEVIRRDNETARTQMTRKGVQVVETPAAMEQEFDKAAKAVWNELAGKLYTREELDMVLKYRDEYRAKNKSAAKQP